MKLENNFLVRHFLVCDRMAKKMCELQGWSVDNFAECVLEEEQGKWANSQMNGFFWKADAALCELHQSDRGEVFFILGEEHEIYLEDLAKLSKEELEEMYNKYCVGNYIINS